MNGGRIFLTTGAVLGMLAVTAGAFGAHWLRSRVAEELLTTFETAARYQMYHALALLGTGILAARGPTATLTGAGWLFLAGTLIFSGSLYLLTFTGARWWGAITPLGGVCLIVGWGLLAWGVVVK